LKGWRKMEIFVLEKSNYDGNDLLMVSTKQEDIEQAMKKEVEDSAEYNEIPYFYITIWRDGICVNTYKGEEAESIVKLL
jgi:hypothetical protein